jgi:hypothetical protein
MATRRSSAARFCSDEHVTFSPTAPVAVGDRVHVVPAHVDHDGDARGGVDRSQQVIDRWPIDLRGW